ncbi:MAG: phospho-N-acetylmuramoyl-pentapeptide-transferase [Candidatus Sungbacteria bacterium]|nr:phospho-N-acetylmuramoyl-pentapeptide-transferase [Candidatus Sungbacteria bacterium]
MPESEIILSVAKVFGLAAASFFTAIALTPVLTHFLYKYKLWRKFARTQSPDGSATPLFNELHKEREVNVPRMGGILIWFTTLFVAILFLFLSDLTDFVFFDKLNFVSRNQTWLPLFTLLAASLLGFSDDILQVFNRGSYIAGGLPFRLRFFVVFAIALIGGYWFFFRLGSHTLFIPFVGSIDIGLWFIPFFVVTMLATFSTSVIDGLDGLAGGVFASIFAAYGGIAFFQNQIDLAAFSGVLLGSLLAFLWFNIPPARFYMGETGILGLTTTLTVVAFLTDSVFVLPIIAFVPAADALSVILQFASKRLRGKKLFLIAPIHHHFEAIGWPHYKVTMRFWVISFVFAIVGMVIALLGR